MAAPQTGLMQQPCSLQFRGIFRAGASAILIRHEPGHAHECGNARQQCLS